MTKQEKILFFESFSGRFDDYMNKYDLDKRIDIVFNQLLKGEKLNNAKLLDAGCGTGWFSQKALTYQAKVYSLDIGEKLLEKTAEKCKGKSILVKGDLLSLPFKDNYFDVVIASEVIEHTLKPKKAIGELARVLKEKGILILTTPNKFWYPVLWLASLFHLRKYKGLENWLSYVEIKEAMKKNGINIENIQGFHAFPFIFKHTNLVLDYLDKYGRILGFLMLNIAVKGRKRTSK